MNEIDLLRAYRANVTGPTPQAIQAARSRLREAIEREQLEAGREEPQQRNRGLFTRRRILVLAGGLAAAVIVAVLALTLSSGPGETESATAALRQAAAVAAAQPNRPPHPGQYAYTQSRNAYITVHTASPPRKTWSVVNPNTRQAWIAPDGSGRLREVAQKPRFLSAEDRRLCRAAHAPDCTSHWQDGGRVSSQNYGPGEAEGPLAYVDTTHLPTDPDRLYRLLKHADVTQGPPYHREKATFSDAQVFVAVGNLLGETYAPPKVRAALYQVAANLPRVQYLGPTQTSVGRQGTGVAYTFNGQRNEFIFDPDTSELIGIRQVAVNPPKALHAPPGSVVGESSFVERGVVDSTSSVPGGP
jgi:hypothetical protein